MVASYRHYSRAVLRHVEMLNAGNSLPEKPEKIVDPIMVHPGIVHQ